MKHAAKRRKKPGQGYVLLEKKIPKVSTIGDVEALQSALSAMPEKELRRLARVLGAPICKLKADTVVTISLRASDLKLRASVLLAVETPRKDHK